jgi:hypothetical protein
MKKVIYIYQDEEKPNKYKVGKADQRSSQEDSFTPMQIAYVRINQQLTASCGVNNIVSAFDVSHYPKATVILEKLIHKKLSLRGDTDKVDRCIMNGNAVLKEGGSTEWFLTTLNKDQFCNVVANLIETLTSKTPKISYDLRFDQSWIKASVLTKIFNGEKVIGAELAARFGKTIWALDLFKTLCDMGKSQYLILPAYVLTAHSSFEKEFYKFKEFNDMILISDKDTDFEENILNNLDKRLVIVVSLCSTNLEKLSVLKNLDHNLKLSIVDEADYGAHTKPSKKIINLIDSSLTLLITGSAIERACSSYKIDSIIQFTQLDMQMVKKGTHPILDPHLFKT